MFSPNPVVPLVVSNPVRAPVPGRAAPFPSSPFRSPPLPALSRAASACA
ncbi:hypothetical protein [Actinomadura sp. CNU-125]|nr:hypothetical protein [Actinomadura sp. CNU-125]